APRRTCWCNSRRNGAGASKVPRPGFPASAPIASAPTAAGPRRSPASRASAANPSVLLPRQAVHAPAAARIAMVPLVERPFEAVQHVDDVPEAGALEGFTGFGRAVAAAADEE